MDLNNVNKVTTSLTEQELQALPKYVREELIDIVENTVFIQNLISPERKYARDLERDSKGRIKVDITNPHILENTDYFREAAIHYEKHGCYTFAYPSKSPNSQFMRYWKEQIRRCYEGYVREEDGEWIPGDFYFYLNFSPIIKVIHKKGSKKGSRVVGFPDFYDGDYFYFHYLHQAKEQGKHADILKSRGKGYSFKGGAGLAYSFFLGDSEEANKNIKGYAIANEKEYLVKDGILNKFVDIIDFLAEASPFPRNRLKNSLNDMHWKLGYLHKYLNIEKGLKNEIIGVTLKNDPQKARGKRGSRIYWEENGKFPNVTQAWQIARPSVEEDGIAFGLMVTWGTGGTEGADFIGAQKFFYSPVAYNILALPNVYDKGTDPTQHKCALFHPVYLNMKECMDKDGNSDVIKALIRELHALDLLIKETNDPNEIIQAKAERPIFPQDALMRKEGSIFPTADLKEHLSQILVKEAEFTSGHFIGDLVIDASGQVKLNSVADKMPIREYPIKNNKNKEGAVEIYTKPYTDAKDIPFGRYIAGMDPFDDDESSTNSLGSIFIMDSVTERIVAEYTGRPRTANEFYEICYRLLKYYNAVCNYENDKKGFFGYMSNKNALHYLSDNPEILKDMQMMKPNYYGNKKKGTNSGKNINRLGRRLLADWLISPAYGEEELLNLHTIRSIGLLRELISWTPDVNADRVSAMGMLMILKLDRETMKESYKKEIVDELNKSTFFGELLKNNIHGGTPNSFLSRL
jgi:hypothetical protein